MENACQIQDKKIDFLKIFKNLDCLKIRQEKKGKKHEIRQEKNVKEKFKRKKEKN